MNKHFPDGWSLQPDKCPADLEFIEWIKSQPSLYPLQVLHMGTGMHHIIGKTFQHDFITGLTISPEEMNEYISLIKETPYLAMTYKVLFADIHLIDERQLAKFDYISLFHLGEIVNTSYSAMPLETVIPEMVGALRRSDYSRILAYSKSAAWDIVQPLFDGMLELVEMYKTLRIYKAK